MIQELIANINWIFPVGDTAIVPNTGYKSIASTNTVFTFSNNAGECVVKGCCYYLASDNYEIKLLFPDVVQVGKHSNVRYLTLPPHTSISLLCHSDNPLQFTILQLTNIIFVFV